MIILLIVLLATGSITVENNEQAKDADYSARLAACWKDHGIGECHDTVKRD